MNSVKYGYSYYGPSHFCEGKFGKLGLTVLWLSRWGETVHLCTVNKQLPQSQIKTGHGTPPGFTYLQAFPNIWKSLQIQGLT